MIFSYEPEESMLEEKEKLEISEIEASSSNTGSKYMGINIKNIQKPSYSLYFLAMFLGLAWNAKKVLKIGVC